MDRKSDPEGIENNVMQSKEQLNCSSIQGRPVRVMHDA